MSEEMKMWIGLGVFMFLPPVIMFLAWLTDRVTDRLNDRATDHSDRPTDRARNR